MWLLSQSASAPEWSDLLLGPLGALALSLVVNVVLAREVRRLQGVTERALPLLARALGVTEKVAESSEEES